MNCNIKICKSECCGAVPVQNVLIEDLKEFINPKAEIIPADDYNSVVFVPGTLKCGFLNTDNKCKIYIARPEVCRMFGDGKQSHPMLKCHYLGQADPEKQERMVDDFLKKLENS